MSPPRPPAGLVPALATMLTTQATVVAAALSTPVLAPELAARLAVAPELVGLHASVLFGTALLALQAAPRLIARFGPVRVSQGSALMAALAMVLAASGTLAGLAVSAVLAGIAYAPSNPASSGLLAAVTPARHRSFVFSLKQAGVPVGGAIAGILAPVAAVWLGPFGAFLAIGALCLASALGCEPWRARLDARVAAPPVKGAPGPMRVIAAQPALRMLAVVAGCLASVQLGVVAIFPTFLAEVTGASLAAAGAVLSTAMLGSIALRIVLGGVADRLGGRAVLAAMAVVVAVSSAALVPVAAGWLTPGFAVTAAIAGVLASISYGWNGVFLAEVAAAARPGTIPTATAGTMSFVFLGGFLGPAAFAAASALAGSAAGGFAVTAGLGAVAVAALVGRARGRGPGAASQICR